MDKPYYSDEAVTIYHLPEMPICDNLSLDCCMEVSAWAKRRHKDIGQGYRARMSPKGSQGQRRDTNRNKVTLRSASGLVQSIMHGWVTASLYVAGVLEPSVVFRLSHARCAANWWPKGTILMGTRQITRGRMLYSFAVNAT